MGIPPVCGGVQTTDKLADDTFTTLVFSGAPITSKRKDKFQTFARLSILRIKHFWYNLNQNSDIFPAQKGFLQLF